MEKYYIVVNFENKTFNAFDEDNYKFIPDEDWVICKIVGEENCEAVMGLLWKILPEYNQVQPNI